MKPLHQRVASNMEGNSTRMKAVMIRTLPLLALLPLTSHAGEIQPFVSDGCSSFPNGTLGQNQLWLSCCTAHDYAYWKGGTVQDRAAADQALEACVAAVGEPQIARLMLAGVRVGGTPYLPTRFRWGYGWPFPRGYRPLTEEETRQIEAMEADQ